MKASLRVLLSMALGLAVASAVAKVVGLLIIFAAISAIVTRPREVIALATTIGFLNLVAAYPLPMFAIIGTLLATHLLTRK